jgi:hypothetical protein
VVVAKTQTSAAELGWTQGQAGSSSKTPWPWQYYLAGVGVVLLVWEAWTLVAWLGAGGGRQADEFRDPAFSTASWWTARVYELIIVAGAMAVATYVVRGCLRQRRITFDGLFCVAAFSAWWIDPAVNAWTPTFLYGQNWLNFTSWCSQMPFVVNKDCGRLPEPWSMGLIYAFGILLVVKSGGWFLRRLEDRGVPPGRRVVLLGLAAIVGELIFEAPAIITHNFNYLGGFDWAPFVPDNIRMPPLLDLAAAVWFYGMFVTVGHFRNDRGETLVERGLERFSLRRRQTLTFLCLVASIQLITMVAAGFYWMMGVYVDPPSRPLPAQILQGMCDRDGFVETRYGPCPGSPGFKAPIRHMPGDNPPEGSWRRSSDSRSP